MKLSREEQDMLEGKHGKAKQKAIEKLIDFGKAVEAESMVPIVGSHIFPSIAAEEASEYDFGAYPIYQYFSSLDAKVKILTTTEPCHIQVDKYSVTGYPWNYKHIQIPSEVKDGIIKGCQLLEGMGVINSFSCIPYLNFSIPKLGEYFTWCESNAACFANSIFGAKTNRETSTTAFYAAITGVHPKYGLMCKENRKGQILFEIQDDVVNNLEFLSDWMALGAFIGIKSFDKIPVVTNLPKVITNDQAKAICSCASPALNYPMINLVGISPEAPSLEVALGGTIPKEIEKVKVTINDLKWVYETMCTAEDDDVDIISIGCPFLSIHEIRDIAHRLWNKKISSNVMFWLQTDFPTYLIAEKLEYISIIEKAGAKIYHSVCMGGCPAGKWGKVNIATNSFKNIKLFAGRGPGYLFGSVKDLVNAGISGKFVSTRW